MESNVENNTTLNQIEGRVLSVPLIDNTLTKTGRSADAKAVGDQVARLDGRIDNVDPHFAKNVQYDNAGTWTDAIDVQGAMTDVLKQTEKYENSGYMKNHWSGENNYFLVGKICIVNFNIQNGLSPAPSNTVFITDLPKPKKTVNFMAWQYDNNFTFDIMPCAITKNGELGIHKALTYQYNFAGTVAYQVE
jgi:hypothetical protein